MDLDLTISESEDLDLGERGLGLATMGLDYISGKWQVINMQVVEIMVPIKIDLITIVRSQWRKFYKPRVLSTVPSIVY